MAGTINATVRDLEPNRSEKQSIRRADADLHEEKDDRRNCRSRESVSPGQRDPGRFAAQSFLAFASRGVQLEESRSRCNGKA